MKRGRIAAVIAAHLACACSAIVAPEDVPIRCTEDDACPQGFVCEDEVCVADADPPIDAGPCVPNDEPELCNGLDDNCNGEIDEGHDADGDGVTWCNGGQSTGRDCNDQDPQETPGKTEVCDGHDNDCNGSTDDGVCQGSLVCEPASGECVLRDCRDDGCDPGYICRQGSDAWSCVVSKNPEDCRNGTLQCEPDEVCNPQNGECVPAGELDSTCRADAECRDHLCVSPASLRMGDGDRFCAKTCCSTSDCPADFVCWQPGGGFSACVSRSRLGLGDGAAGGGAGCASDSDCASGSCVGSNCGEPCCDDGDCGGGNCTVAFDDGAPDSVKLICGSGGPFGAGFLCGADEDCGALFCVDPGYCTAPCCTSDACGEGMVCTYATISAANDPQGRLCVSDLGWGGPLHGDGPAGSDCFDGADCRSDRCEGGYCVDTCCSNADCPGATSCRLSAVRDGGELLCLVDP